MAMFYSDNPARDWDNYCEYQERLNKEWHEENDPRLQEEIENLEYLIQDLEKCKTNEEIDEIMRFYEVDPAYDYGDDIEARLEDEIGDIRIKIKDLKEELADE